MNKSSIQFLLLGMFWIYINQIPMIPIGLIIGLILFRKKIKKYSIYLIVGLILGFLGTGVIIDLDEELVYNQTSKVQYTKYNSKIVLKLGFKSIDKIRNKGKIVIYNNEKLNFDIEDGKDLTDIFIKKFNHSEFDTLVPNFFNRQIDTIKLKQFMSEVYDKTNVIVDYKFLGFSDYYERNDSSTYNVFYNITPLMQSEFNYLLLTILDTKEGDVINRIEFIFKTTKFRIINK